MLNPSDGKEIQQNYLEVLDALIDKIRQAALTAGKLNPNSESQADVTIQVGTKNVYKEVPGQQPKITITADQVQKLRTALEDPGNLKGTVQIKIGKELVFQAANGKVKIDELGLTQAQTETQSAKATAPTEAAPSPEPVAASKVKTPRNAEAQLKQQVADLSQTVEQQSQRIAALEKKLDILSNSLSSIENKSLSRWLGSTLSSAAQGFRQKVADWASESVKTVQYVHQNSQSILQSLLKQSESQVTPQQALQQLDDSVQLKLKAIENRVGTVSDNFERGVKDIQSKLAGIQAQLQTLQNDPAIQSAVKAALSKVIEPAIGTVLEKTGVIRTIEPAQAATIQHQTEKQSGKIQRPSELLQAKELETAVKTILKYGGTIEGDAVVSKGDKYTLRQDLSGASVTVNADSRVIFQADKFTSLVESSDLPVLKKLVTSTQESFALNQSHSQSQSKVRSR